MRTMRMGKATKRTLSVLLALAMSLTMLVALPTAVHAATGEAAINIATLGATNANNSADLATDSQWTYNGTTKVLTFTTPNGNYELTGRNDAIAIVIDAAGSTVTMRGTHITSPAGAVPLTVRENCTIEVYVDYNTVTSTNAFAVSVSNGVTCAFTGDGILTITSPVTNAIFLDTSANLSLSDDVYIDAVASAWVASIFCMSNNTISVGATARLTATGGAAGIVADNLTIRTNGVVVFAATGVDGVGIYQSAGSSLFLQAPGTESGMVSAIGGPGGRAIFDAVSISMDDRITLTLINNSTSDETYSIASSTALSSLVWMPSPASIMTTGSGSSSTIGVTIPANTVGTIYRGSDLATHLCKIERTNVGYYSLEAALAAASSGDTVILLRNIVEDPGHALVITRDATIDMDEFDLEYLWNIRILTPIDVSFKNGKDLTVSSFDIIYGTLEIEADNFILADNYFGAYFGAEVTIDANVTAQSSAAVCSYSYADVTVNGNITAAMEGVWAQADGIVTVFGNIEAGTDGVFADSGGSVTVNGSITADESGVNANDGAIVVVNGSITAEYFGVTAQGAGTEVIVNDAIDAGLAGVSATIGAVVTVTGAITAGTAGVEAYDDAAVTVTGSIDAGEAGVLASLATVIITGNITADWYGVMALSGAIVEVEGDITTWYGIFALGVEISVTVVGEIYASDVGVLVSGMPGGPSRDVEITVTGNITVEYDDPDIHDTGAGVIAADCIGLIITVNGDIDAWNRGVESDYCVDAQIFIDGSIVAGYVGVYALEDVEVFVNGNIVVTSDEPLLAGEILVGVASGFGAEVTVEGTITAANYIALYFEEYTGSGPGLLTFAYVNANENVIPTSKNGYLEYNDSDLMETTSFVWVRGTTTPGTGDSAALWLLLGALLIAALGTASVFAYRKRTQQEKQQNQ